MTLYDTRNAFTISYQKLAINDMISLIRHDMISLSYHLEIFDHDIRSASYHDRNSHIISEIEYQKLINDMKFEIRAYFYIISHIFLNFPRQFLLFYVKT